MTGLTVVQVGGVVALCLGPLAACGPDGAAGPSGRVDNVNDTSADSGDPELDVDGDGWPAPDDCDDGDADVFPGADEVGNGVDDDCDGVDPGVRSCLPDRSRATSP